MRSTVFAFLLLSARGGAAALAAWAVCKLLRRAHAPSRLLCWLWLAVGLRFVLPWGIPLSLPRPQNTQLAAAADTVQELGELPLVAPPPAVSAPAAALPWYARLTPWHALAAVWAVGVAVLAVRGIVGYIKLKCHVALACKTSDGCYSGACVTAPFTLGILRPRVYLPDDLQGTARQAVLLHEQTHIRRRDPLTKPLFYAVACLHWFNPLVWLAFCTFERDMEAACDEAAVRGRPLPERNAYCESLLHFAVQGRSIPGSLAFGQGSVKERIVHLLHYRRLGAGALAVCAAVVGLSVTACMVRPQVEDAPATAAPPATAETAEPTPPPHPHRPACPLWLPLPCRHWITLRTARALSALSSTNIFPALPRTATGATIYALPKAPKFTPPRTVLCWPRRSITAGAILSRSTTAPTPTVCAGPRCTPTCSPAPCRSGRP